MGPNTGLGHNSILFMIECQTHYVMQAIRAVRRENLAWIDVQPEVQHLHNREIQARLEKTVWQSGGCKSWYQNAQGKNTTLYPGFTFEYRMETRHFDLADYDKRAQPTTLASAAPAFA